MTTYEITFNENDVQGKSFLKFMKTLPFISVSKNETKKMSDLEEALKDIEEGRVSEIEDWDAFSEQMEKEALNEI